MGILNATPDSFYDLGSKNTLGNLLQEAEKMVREGAAILDIGGMSSRPGAGEITEEEEWQRIGKLVRAIRKEYPDTFISVDTYRSGIATRAAEEGADIINDISAGEMDPQMIPTVATLKLPYIAMHMQGQPRNMQNNPQYENITQDILAYFIRKIRQCADAGIKDLIIDPGFGFGKTLEQNYELLHNLHQFSILERPLLAGLSRKSFIYKLLKTTPDKALNGTVVLNTLALQQGASLLRVHDVQAARECIEIGGFYKLAANY
jgi:dihydropteroate synthase